MGPVQRHALYRWHRLDYERLLDLGVLDEDDPIELLDGLLLVKEPQHSAHRTAIVLVAKAVERAFGDGWFVQTQSPIVLDDRSEPEPDVCVIAGAPRDYAAPGRRRSGYASIETSSADGAIAPLAAPRARVRVGDLLP